MDSLHPVALAMIGTGGTFLCTTIGAAAIFFFKDEINEKINRAFLGFAAGIMIAASVWSLLLPAIEMAEAQGMAGWIPAGGGFILGWIFIALLDTVMPHLHPGSDVPEGMQTSLHRSTLLVLAVTLHNIPEGMAVGLTFGLAGDGATETISLTGAIALAVGIGLQNIPEGAAVSLPLKNSGLSRKKAFLLGAGSGAIEPVAGLVGVLLATTISGFMPWLLALAAGAMIYVVVEELIPEAHLGEHSHIGTTSVMAGFLVMMILDIALG